MARRTRTCKHKGRYPVKPVSAAKPVDPVEPVAPAVQNPESNPNSNARKPKIRTPEDVRKAIVGRTAAMAERAVDRLRREAEDRKQKAVESVKSRVAAQVARTAEEVRAKISNYLSPADVKKIRGKAIEAEKTADRTAGEARRREAEIRQNAESLAEKAGKYLTTGGLIDATARAMLAEGKDHLGFPVSTPEEAMEMAKDQNSMLNQSARPGLDVPAGSGRAADLAQVRGSVPPAAYHTRDMRPGQATANETDDNAAATKPGDRTTHYDAASTRSAQSRGAVPPSVHNYRADLGATESEVVETDETRKRTRLTPPRQPTVIEDPGATPASASAESRPASPIVERNRGAVPPSEYHYHEQKFVREDDDEGLSDEELKAATCRPSRTLLTTPVSPCARAAAPWLPATRPSCSCPLAGSGRRAARARR
jgi:hypothetical protein